MKIRWNETAGYLMIITASCFWGGAASFGKTLMLGGISTIRLMEIRSVVSTLVVLILLALFGRKHLRIHVADLPGLVLLAIPGLALVNASYYQAVQMMPVAIAAFIQFTAPAFIFLYGVLTHAERPTLQKFLALLLSLAGTYLMLQISTGSAQTLPVFGLVCAFASMVSYAFYVIVSHRLSRIHSSWTLVVYSYGITSLFWCLLANPWTTSAELTQHHLWPHALWFSFCSTLVPFVLFLTGLRRVSATGASIASTSETVMAALFAFLMLGETLAPAQILGAAFILTAVLLLILHSTSEAQQMPVEP